MHEAPWFVDGARRSDEGLAGYLAAEHPLTVFVGLHTAEDVDLDRFQVEQFDQVLQSIRHAAMLPRRAAAYAADMGDVIERSCEALDGSMRRALELAWESACAGSLGVGAVVSQADGAEVATGRNRLFEHDPGDDVLAGSSLAHAELNVLAKLPIGHHEDDELVLHTTLQPCIQCLAAIRLSPVRRVRMLAPDPIMRGVERIEGVNAFVARRWPQIEQVAITEWSVLALLLPTHAVVLRSILLDEWSRRLPIVTDTARRMVGSGLVVEQASVGADIVTFASSVWSQLSECVHEVQALSEVHE